ncbi:MAG TPA: endonuclease/exonuclease/phosphatase family protein [Thermoanaerobaculia bacterium]|nr:endonuclease/exonuclease/phosphatase family protein [Thermoanaerobaculia bacterium]
MRIRIVSYNIHKGIGVDRRFRLARIAEILEHYDAQVLMLQEVDQGVPRSRRLDLARELAQTLDYPFCVLGLNVRLKEGRYGNAILSRLPIVTAKNIDLSLPESWIRRGCQHAALDLGRGRRLEAFNLHLGLSARERDKQVSLLSRSAEFRRADPDAPTIVCGDFNDWRSLLVSRFTDDLGFRWATGGSGERHRAIRTYPSFSPRGGLDRFYYRGPLDLANLYACRLKLSRVASDHLPLIADFQVH